MNTNWNGCRGCHTATHDLQNVTADLLKLVRRADRGASVAPQIKAKQDEANLIRLKLKAHKEVGLDNPHPVHEHDEAAA